MSQTTPAGLDALLALLPELYAPVDAEQFPRRLVKLIEQFLPWHLIGFTEVDLLRSRASGVVSQADFDMKRWMPVFDAHVGEHPLIRHFQQHPEDRRILRFSDVTTLARFHRTGIYNEFFRPLDRRHQMALTVRAGPRRVIGVAVSRGGPDFSDAECLLLAALRPHILRAYQNAKVLTRQRKLLETCRHALDESNAALIAVENGRVTLVTARARRLLGKYFPDSRRGIALHRNVRHCLAQLQPTPSAAKNGMAGATVLVARCGEDELRLRLLAGRHSAERLGQLEELASVSPRELQSLGLTAREAEVSCWLMRGKSNPEIGVITGLSARTVEKHLERVYAKLGVENRVAATLHLVRHLGGELPA